MVLVTHAGSPYRSAADVMAAARANPATSTTAPRVPARPITRAMVLFESQAGVRMNPCPTRQRPADDRSGGRARGPGRRSAAASAALHPVRQGARPGDCQPATIPLLPDVPTAAEIGLPGYEVSSRHGLVVPAGTPQPALDKLNREINRILTEDEVQRAFAAQGVTPDGGSPAVLRDFIASQMALWKRVIQQHGIKAE